MQPKSGIMRFSFLYKTYKNENLPVAKLYILLYSKVDMYQYFHKMHVWQLHRKKNVCRISAVL